MKLFSDVLKRYFALPLLWLIISAVLFAVLLLYGLPAEPALYASAVGLFFTVVFFGAEYFKERKRARERLYAKQSVLADRACLPEPCCAAEEDYRQMVTMLGSRMEQLLAEFDAERRDAEDYYTAWVHQIKTPIAVMKLKLSEDTPEHRALSAELFRIEQYVDMVLRYIRLGGSDLVIREYSLDGIIRETLRKFAPLFVEKRLKLDYTPSDITVTTDKKWFGCVLEQLLSNAVKYTPAGTVSVFARGGGLTVRDTGVGIAPEDLPRIFEKGYTGNNGRIGEKSSGIGLYLAKKAADLLALELTAESVPGEGSSFTLRLPD